MNLILIPTKLERDAAEFPRENSELQIRLCGFGPVAAASQSAGWISELRPQRVFLVGIAGAYGRALTVGAATQFQSVSLYGVGVGSGAAHLAEGDLGFAESVGQQTETRSSAYALQLDFLPQLPSEKLLLTVCSGSGDLIDADYRLEKFPSAAAEDMEGYGVALSCQRFSVPLTIIRGISNVVGERDYQKWEIAPAMSAASSLLSQAMDSVRNFAS